MIGRIAVSDVLEWKVSVEPNEPSCKSEKEFGERRMHIEVVLSVDIVRRELAEMDFIETGEEVFDKYEICEEETRRAYTTWSGTLIL
jgi:hypothetical protein